MESNNRFPGLPLAGMHLPAVRILLTEDAIKRAFVGFLKKHYKNRYEVQPDSFQASLDNISQSGLIADGILRFTQTNGKVFTCAYEATSRDRIDEVRFTLNVVYFLWDCVAFGAVVAAAVFAFFFATNRSWLLLLGVQGNVGMLLGVWLMGFLAWYFTLRPWRKYRYIFAVEQFKQYFADDQWIALANDVFPSPVDPYLTELREQCTYHGFGLAIVDADAQVRIVVSPSRLDFYGKDRRIVEWVANQQWYKALTTNPKVLKQFRPPVPSAIQIMTNRIARPLQHLVWEPAKKFLWKALQQPLSDSNEAFEKFMKGQQVQKLIFFTALMVIGMLSWQLANEKAEKEPMTFQEIRDLYGGQNPEDYPYVVTGEPIPYQGGIVKQNPEEAGDENYRDTFAYQERTGEPLEPLIVKPGPIQKAPVIGKPGDPCAVFDRFGWMVIDYQYVNREAARLRIEDLRALGFDAEDAPLYCIEKGVTGYVVYLGTIFSEETQAQEMLQNFTLALEKAKKLNRNGKPKLKKLVQGN